MKYFKRGCSVHLSYFRIMLSKVFEFEQYLEHSKDTKKIVIFGEQYTSLNTEILKNTFFGIEELEIHCKNFTKIPNELEQLKNLKKFTFTNNEVVSDFSMITKMKKVEVVNLSYNMQLFVLPNDISELTNLRSFILNNNFLSSLPCSIGELTNLKEINLAYNRISSLSCTIGSPEAIEFINLSHNLLQHLPKSIIGFTKIRQLNLVGNELDTLSNSENVGIDQLENTFKHRFIYDTKENYYQDAIVSIKSVVKGLQSQDVYWNLKKLKTADNTFLQPHRMSKTEILESMDEKVAIQFANYSDYLIFRDFIELLYSEIYYYQWKRVSTKYINEAKDLVEGIVDCVITNVNFDTKIFNLIATKFVEGIKYCPEDQIGQLRSFYYALVRYRTPTSIIRFITHFLQMEKELTFELFQYNFTKGVKYIDFLNCWKYYIGAEIGLYYHYLPTESVHSNFDYRGNALQEFYIFFTPQKIIEKLTNEINKNKDMLSVAFEFIKNLTIPKKMQNQMFLCARDVKNLYSAEKITPYFIKYLMIQNNMLVDRRESYVLNKCYAAFYKCYKLVEWAFKLFYNYIQKCISR